MIFRSLRLKKQLNIKGFTVKWFKKISSTNDYGKILTSKNLEGLILADTQTKGRGRLNRTFYSPDKLGVYMSISLIPANLSIEKIGLVTTRVAYDISNVLEELTGKSFDLKWVNDVYINGKKVCGILVESSLSTDNKISSLVIGIGIDVYNGGYPSEIDGIASNIEKETGIKVDREELIIEITKRIRNSIYNLNSDFIEGYKEKMFLLSKKVIVDKGNETFEGVIEDVLEDGSLLVNRDGKQVIVNYGDVSVKAL